MLRRALPLRMGFIVLLIMTGGGRLFALADEITNLQVNNSGVEIEMMGTKPVYTADRFTSGGGEYFLLTFSHSVLLGSPRQRYILPNRSATITAAQYSDRPHIVHLLVRDRNTTSFAVTAERQPGSHYRIVVHIGGSSGKAG